LTCAFEFPGSFVAGVGYGIVSVGKYDKDIKDVVDEISRHGWTEVAGKNYRKFRCPCGRHMKTIHKSPSNPNYFKNLMAWFRRQECWQEGEQ
jgi:hypothetical protein